MSKQNTLSEASKTPHDQDEQNNPEVLPGWPGYRTRAGRSGLDPIDARTEAAHTFGTLIQQLLTGQLKVRNPIYLFLLGAFGLVLILPLFLAVSGMLKGNLFPWDGWIILVLTGIAGLAMLIVFIKNLIKLII